MNSTYFNSPAYIDCEGPGKLPGPDLPGRPAFANLFPEIHQQGVHRQAGTIGELLDLFFARLLPSGTGDSPPALLGLGKSKRTR